MKHPTIRDKLQLMETMKRRNDIRWKQAKKEA